MATVGFGDFEWDEDKPARTSRSMAYPSRRPARSFSTPTFWQLTTRRHLIASSPWVSRVSPAFSSSFTSSVARRSESSAPDEPVAPKEKTMNNDETTQAEPSEASLAEMPEVDFSRAIRPNKLAALRGDFKQAVFLDKELWQHFGSEERVLEALRMLVSLAERSSRSVA